LVDFTSNTPSTDLEDRHVERAAAKVVHRDGAGLGLVETVSEAAAVGSLMMRSTSRPAILAGILGGLTLRVVEIGGNG